MNEMRLLEEVPLPEALVRLVPSGTMLQVIVAGAPLPDRDPEAVESQGSGSLGVIIKPSAGAAASKVYDQANAERYAANRRMR
jgi:hypothetical protein